MNKQIGIIGIVLLLLVTSVMAKGGIPEQIDELQYQINTINNELNVINLYLGVDGSILDEYGQRLDEHDARFNQVNNILRMYGWTLSIQGWILNQQGQRISNLEQYIRDNEDNWGASVTNINTRSGGLRIETVEKLLQGSFWEVLLENFALKSKVDELENRIDHLEARMFLGIDASDLDVELFVGQLQAKRIQSSVLTNSGFTCYSTLCFKLN